jgi:hypothetical protein
MIKHMQKEIICGIIGLILSLPVAFLSYHSGALCCFNSILWSIGPYTFIILSVLICVFSIMGFIGSLISKSNHLLSINLMLGAGAGLLIISPFILFLSCAFFFLGGFIVNRNSMQKPEGDKYKFTMRAAISVIVVIFFFFSLLFIINPLPYEGKYLYRIGDWSGNKWGGRLDFKGDIVAWIECGEKSEGYICVLDISDVNSPSLILKEKIDNIYRSKGPFIMDGEILWRDNITYYLYDISFDKIQIVDIKDDLGIDGYIAIKENDYVKIYNLNTGNIDYIINDSYCYALYNDLLIWGELRNVSDWEKSYYDVWLCNLTYGEKVQILSNLSSEEQTRGSIDIYEKTIAYSDNICIYTYDVDTNKTSKIAEHSRKNIMNEVGQYFNNIRIFKDNLIYIEFSHEIVGMDEYELFNKYWVVNISTKNKVELKTAYCIDDERVVGSTFFTGNDSLYLVELKNLF